MTTRIKNEGEGAGGEGERGRLPRSIWEMFYPTSMLVSVLSIFSSRLFLTMIWGLSGVYFNCVLQIFAQSRAILTEQKQYALLGELKANITFNQYQNFRLLSLHFIFLIII